MCLLEIKQNMFVNAMLKDKYFDFPGDVSLQRFGLFHTSSIINFERDKQLCMKTFKQDYSSDMVSAMIK